MNIVRAAARLLTGTTYTVLGFDALRTPGGRVDVAAPTLDALRTVLPLPKDNKVVVRANGAAQTVTGAALALGLAPRTSALVLACSLIPTTYAGHAFWKITDPAQRKGQRIQVLKNTAMLGGLLLISIDRG